MSHPILLYDGVCGLCNRLVQFVLRRDRADVFRFASLQSAAAGRILSRHGARPTDLDTVYVVLDYELPNESLLSRSDAVLFVLKRLGVLWRPTIFLLWLVPKFVRDWEYDLIARRRYGWFERLEACAMPREEDRERFLDV